MSRPGIGSQTALRVTLPRGIDHSLPRALETRLHPLMRRALNQREKQISQHLKQGSVISVNELREAECTLERSAALGISAVSFFDEDYPPLLRLIPRPPALLYYLGDLKSLAQPSVAIVGTRRPSPQGLQRVTGSIAHLAQSGLLQTEKGTPRQGYCVISGLALGVDGRAHQAAIHHGLYTVAVVGGGLDTCSPRQHESLWAEIIHAGGAILSEIPVFTPPTPASLVSRDRIQAGLATATYVAESSVKGGALHAARAAIKQDRTLWFPQSHRSSLLEFRGQAKVKWLSQISELTQAINELKSEYDELIKQSSRVLEELNIAKREMNTLSLLSHY